MKTKNKCKCLSPIGADCVLYNQESLTGYLDKLSQVVDTLGHAKDKLHYIVGDGYDCPDTKVTFTFNLITQLSKTSVWLQDASATNGYELLSTTITLLNKDKVPQQSQVLNNQYVMDIYDYPTTVRIDAITSKDGKLNTFYGYFVIDCPENKNVELDLNCITSNKTLQGTTHQLLQILYSEIISIKSELNL